MPIVKIQHADPASSHVIAFDILAADDMDTVKDTFVLESGHFKLIDLAGGMVLREVTHGELAERERKYREDRELEAEVERERLADEQRQRDEREQADREQRKEEIRGQADDQPRDKMTDPVMDADQHDSPFEPAPEDHNLDPVLPPHSDERDNREHELDAAGIRHDEPERVA